MEEDFSLSVNGAEIQKKMPFSSPSYIGISQLNLLKSDVVPSNSQSFSENLIIKRAEFPRSSFQRDEINSNTPIASINLRSNHSEVFSIDKELMGMMEKPHEEPEKNTDNQNAHYSASKPSNCGFESEKQAFSQKYAKYGSGAINILKHYPVIRKIMENFKNRTVFRKQPANLNSFHLKFLRDSCYFQSKPVKFVKISQYLSVKDLMPYQKLKKITKCVENRVKSLNFYMFCSPFHKFLEILKGFTWFEYNYGKILLETCKILIFCYFSLEFSFELAANQETRQKYGFLSRFLVLFVLSLEFCVNSLLKPRKLFENPSDFKRNRQIPRNYADFCCKFVGLLSFYLYFLLQTSDFARFFNVFLVFYCKDMSKTAGLLALLAKKREFCEKMFDFLWIFLQFFALLHSICCFGFFLGFFSAISAQEPFSDGEISYFQGMLVSFRLFFVPLQQNSSVSLQIQHLFMLFLWIFMIFYTIFAVFSRYFLTNSSKPEENLLKTYIKLNKLPVFLQLDLLKYSETSRKTLENEDLSKSLSFLKTSFHKSLRKEIMKHSDLMNFSSYSRFLSHFSNKTSNKLLNKLTYRLLKPGEFLYKQGEIDPCLYLVLTGCVELSFVNTRNHKNLFVFQEIRSKQCINEFELLTANAYRFSAQSCGFSSVLQLKRDDFLEIVRQTPEDFEHFCMVRDQIVLYQNYAQINEKCSACDLHGHFLAECPVIHHIPEKSFIISRFNYSSCQQRREFSRKFKKRQNSLYFAAQNRYFAAQMSVDFVNKQRSFADDDELDAGYQEQSSLMYPSDYSMESEDDFSEEEFGKPKAKSSNTLPSIKRDKVDSLEVINEESKIGTLPVNTRSNVEIPLSNANLFGLQEDFSNKFNTKLLETKAFDTKRNISATELKVESKIMTEGGKMFEDYLKRNSLLSKQSSIAKNTQSVSEFQANKPNPHYKNVNAALSLTENKSIAQSLKRRNSIMVNTVNTNTATKSNKSSKASKNTVFDLFMEFDAVARFLKYFPENNCENIVEKMGERRNVSKSFKKNARNLKKPEEKEKKTSGNTKKTLKNKGEQEKSQRNQEDRSFKDVKTLDSKKSHFVSFKNKGKKTSIEAKRLFY